MIGHDRAPHRWIYYANRVDDLLGPVTLHLDHEWVAGYESQPCQVWHAETASRCHIITSQLCTDHKSCLVGSR